MRITISQAFSFCQQGGRDYQEDARYPDIDQVEAGQRFFLVCDGVGGSDHGELASRTVCKAFAEKIDKLDLRAGLTEAQFSDALSHAYDQLDNAARTVDGDMATTLTFVCFHAGGCAMAHIGDSRIYHIRGNAGILYRSEDHSLVADMVHNGLITPSEAANHPQRNVITRCMEPSDSHLDRSEASFVNTTDVEPGDCFFLCSDGVLHELGDDRLVSLLTSSEKSDGEIIREIAGISASSDDNNTAFLIRIGGVEREEVPAGVQKDEESSSDGSDTSTHPLPRPSERLHEVSPKKLEKERTGFLNFIEKIFKSKKQ